MRELEQKFAEWRAKANAALPGQPETVRELEEHLRDHVAALTQKGVAPLGAFATAARQLGESSELAREFQGTASRWFGAMGSREFRFLAYVAGSLGLAGGLLYARLFYQAVRWKLPTENMPLAIGFTFSLALVCAAAVGVSGRFLRKPSVGDARSLIAFNLFAVWMLAGPALGVARIYYPIWVALMLGVVVVLIALWRVWTRHLERKGGAHV